MTNILAVSAVMISNACPRGLDVDVKSLCYQLGLVDAKMHSHVVKTVTNMHADELR